MGKRLARISQGIEQRQKLEGNWWALSGFVDTRLSAGSAASLDAKDVLILAELFKSETRSGIACKIGIRRDSVDKRLGGICERLGLENHHPLLSILAELEFSPSLPPSAPGR